ncbi:hypothetical protein QJS04_geneDACA014468 [Acorus gramineus]|uniref:Uncharacterized protein n=1 Tax=Acorus gramineus TaxID=55184 RepID=A0AAV9BRF6_ACOGR|nr:hypothetical protein QJS04_geneDACA014468 [Acorus gramineus]
MHENVMQHQTMGGADMTEMVPREQDGAKPSYSRATTAANDDGASFEGANVDDLHVE